DRAGLAFSATARPGGSRRLTPSTRAPEPAGRAGVSGPERRSILALHFPTTPGQQPAGSAGSLASRLTYAATGNRRLVAPGKPAAGNRRRGQRRPVLPPAVQPRA